jgi:hypothetical protein
MNEAFRKKVLPFRLTRKPIFSMLVAEKGNVLSPSPNLFLHISIGYNTMLPIPQNHSARFNKALLQSPVPVPFHGHYRKWLRYFLDFCSKYPPPEDKSAQVRFFIEKLKSKRQTPQQCTQAAHAVSLFFESQQPKYFPHPAPVEEKSPPPSRLAIPSLKARNIFFKATKNHIPLFPL